MSRHDIESVSLLIAQRAAREVEVPGYGDEDRLAMETPALVAGDADLLLEIAYRRWEDSGQVVCLSRGPSAPDFDRLLHGARLGVRQLDDAVDFCEVGVLRWDAARHWGNVVRADLSDLAGDSTPAQDLLFENGCLALDTRAQVLGDTGRRRNYLTACFPVGDVVVPLLVYTLTRVLPVLKALDPGAQT